MSRILTFAISLAVIASASYAAGSNYKHSKGFQFAPPKNGFFGQPATRTATRSTATVTRTNKKKTGFSTFFNRTR